MIATFIRKGGQRRVHGNAPEVYVECEPGRSTKECKANAWNALCEKLHISMSNAKSRYMLAT